MTIIESYYKWTFFTDEYYDFSTPEAEKYLMRVYRDYQDAEEIIEKKVGHLKKGNPNAFDTIVKEEMKKEGYYKERLKVCPKDTFITHTPIFKMTEALIGENPITDSEHWHVSIELNRKEKIRLLLLDVE